ncbi:MAG: CapA family protein [Syntrophomonadaceae bacterium]|nr:CapA family protein [Syntrophomonadaceae bacterium]
MVRKLFSLIIALLVVIAGWTAYHRYHESAQEPEAVQVISPPPGQSQQQHLVITAAGDCLMHNTQIWAGQEGQGFNFDHFFQDIKPYLEEGQITSTCFEAPMAGAEAGYAGYPLFNSPDAMADTFKNAGFDIIATAHNHILDRGVKGALRTMEVLKSRGLEPLGTYSSAADCRKPVIKAANGIKVGYLGYTYSTNGIPVPENYDFLVNFIEPDKIVEDIQKLRPEVDIVVLVLHWGVEYTPQPTAEQKRMARMFLEAGADVILGSHPHVIQTMEVLNINDQPKFVIYGMGNFISHQKGPERNSGIVLKIEFSKDMRTNHTKIVKVDYTPTFSHHYQENGRTRFRVVAIEDTIERIQEGRETVFTSEDIPMLQAVLDDTRRRLGPAWSGWEMPSNE